MRVNFDVCRAVFSSVEPVGWKGHAVKKEIQRIFDRDNVDKTMSTVNWLRSEKKQNETVQF